MQREIDLADKAFASYGEHLGPKRRLAWAVIDEALASYVAAPGRREREAAPTYDLDDIGELACGAILDCVRELRRSNYAEISANQDPESWELDYLELLTTAGEEAISGLGIEITDEIGDEISSAIEHVQGMEGTADWVGFDGGNGEECEIAAAFYAEPERPDHTIGEKLNPLVRPRLIVCGHRHRRASRPAAVRRRGGRRLTKSSSSDDPGGPSDEPPGGGRQPELTGAGR